MLIKLTIFIVVAGGGAVLTWFKRRESRKTMKRLASGLQCMSCDSGEVDREMEGVRCRACGYFTSNALLGAPVSDAELNDLTERDPKKWGEY